MGGNEHYVKERPNPYALTHSQIFERLSGHGDAGPAGGAGGSPTVPLRSKAQELLGALDDLARMVLALNYSFQAESTQRGITAIKTVSTHVESLGEHAGRLAEAFEDYAGAVQTARARLPEPVPLADFIDAVQQESPGLLAQLPVFAQLEEEHDGRTRVAQEVYRQLDQVAVKVDDSTAGFDRMSAPTTTTQQGVLTVDANTPATRWPSSGVHPSSVPPGSPTPTAGYPPGSTTPAPLLPPSPTAPAPTPGAGGASPAPLPVRPGTPGASGGRDWPSSAGRPPVPLPVGRPGGPAGRPGGDPVRDADSRLSSRAGLSDGPGRGMGPGGGGRAGAAPTQPVGISTMGRDGGGAGSRGVSGSGLGPMGAGGRREEDQEHRRPSYLEEAEDPSVLFGADQRVAPPVIGVMPPAKDC